MRDHSWEYYHKYSKRVIVYIYADTLGREVLQG